MALSLLSHNLLFFIILTTPINMSWKKERKEGGGRGEGERGGGGGGSGGKHDWQWTRHFLKRVNGEGEWIVEGSMPEPVVMFLQILRFLRRVDSF